MPFGVSQDVIRCHFVIYKGKKWVSHHGVMWGGNREVDEWRKGSIFGGMVRGSIPHHGVMWGGNREVDEWRKGSIFGEMVRGSIPPAARDDMSPFCHP